MLQLFATRMSADVYARIDHLVNHPRATTEKIIDRPRDGFLIARYWTGAENHRVIWLDFHEVMVAAGDPTHDAGWLTLTASGQQNHFVRWQIVRFTDFHQASFWNIHKAQL